MDELHDLNQNCTKNIMGHGSIIGFKTSCGGEDIRLFKRVYSGKVVKSKEESHAATTNMCVCITC